MHQRDMFPEPVKDPTPDYAELMSLLRSAIETLSRERAERHANFLKLDKLEERRLTLQIQKLELEITALSPTTLYEVDNRG